MGCGAIWIGVRLSIPKPSPLLCNTFSRAALHYWAARFLHSIPLNSLVLGRKRLTLGAIWDTIVLYTVTKHRYDGA